MRQQETVELDTQLRDMIVTLRGAEIYAGDRLRAELYELRYLSISVATNVARVIRLSPKQAERTLQGATAAAYLGSLLDDLRAADAVICAGYSTVALGIVAGLMDGVAMFEAFGTSRGAAEKFFKHTDLQYHGVKTLPGLRRLSQRVRGDIPISPEALSELLAEWYAEASAAKHKNPVILRDQIKDRGYTLAVHSGPSCGDPWTSRSADALAMGTTVLLLGALAYGREYHCDEETLAKLRGLCHELLHGFGYGDPASTPDHDDGKG